MSPDNNVFTIQSIWDLYCLAAICVSIPLGLPLLFLHVAQKAPGWFTASLYLAEMTWSLFHFPCLFNSTDP